MPKLNVYVEVGICSGYLDGDYAVNGKVANLSLADMKELRLAMIGAIVCMEKMWRREQALKPENQAVDATPKAPT